jgi:3-oxoacyl-[acyl-carrier protein] reductase
MDLSNKIALVTGSGRGIGQAIALRLAESGATVVINDVNDAANEVAEQLKSAGKPGAAIIADVSSAAQVEQMLETVKNTFGRIDILVNNAGIARDQIILRMSEEDWDKVITINLKSVFLCTRAALKYMIRQRSGRIVNISSIVGIVGNPGQVNYSSAKAGIIGFTRTIAKEVASRQITVNAVAPGAIDSEMTQRLPEAQREELKKRVPLGYIGSPRDVAEAVAFLASHEARYITGQILGVDGGMAGAWW